MELKEPFLLEGISYNREQLSDLCLLAEKDVGMPLWKRDVFAFIKQCMDPFTGEVKQYTSGTTGDPKPHSLSMESMVISARKTLLFFKLKRGDKALLSLPIRYIAGKLMVVRALVGGLDLLLAEPAGRPLTSLKQQVNLAAMVPLQVHETVEHGDDLSLISSLIIGGGELRHSLREQLSLMQEPNVYETFGMTETYTHFALKRINGNHPQSAFHLLDGVSITLDDRNCLVVSVAGITQGPLTTNDLVEIDASGRSFRWLGRYDHVINTGGIKVIPERVEEQIRRLIGVDCLLLPEPDERLGERLVLLAEIPESDPPAGNWLSSLSEVLSTYEIPKRIVTVKEIPRNPSMKKDRAAARLLITKN
jgi:O-succinylbenzoic acid--CoA ligase